MKFLKNKIKFLKNPKNLAFFIFLSLGITYLYHSKEILNLIYSQSFVVGAITGFLIMNTFLLLGLYILSEFIYNRQASYKRFVILCYKGVPISLNPFRLLIFLIFKLRKILKKLRKILKKLRKILKKIK
jgi:hypothetical protein